MICPKCHAEYREGFTECSDCKVALGTGYKDPGKAAGLSNTGISLIKYGIGLIFLIIFEVIITVIAYEFYFVYSMNHGGVGGTVLSNIHPFIWILITIEAVIAILVVIWGAFQRNKKY
ncbi:MAG: hypothetical protein K0R50_1382 [Eubacterium sp.]|jgi:hypothetical protein|nr:hypothetical protein [Eubacterium sp.]